MKKHRIAQIVALSVIAGTTCLAFILKASPAAAQEAGSPADPGSRAAGAVSYETPNCEMENGLRICVLPGPVGNAGSVGITSGLGSLWLDGSAVNEVFRFGTKGASHGYPIPTQGANPEGITLGPDKRIWFTEWSAGNVGALDPPTGTTTECSLGFSPIMSTAIVTGADKHLWVPTDYNGMFKVNPATCQYVDYDLGSQNDAQPTAVTLGSDGNVWFNEWNGVCSQGGGSYDSVGKITPEGVVTLYPVGANGNGFGIAGGPDGRVWFADPGGCDGNTSRIGAITTDGSSYTYYTEGVPADVVTIINGGDGNLYFGTYTTNQIGRITPSGTVTVWNIPSVLNGFAVLGMTVGPDHNIWFADNAGDYVGVLYLK